MRSSRFVTYFFIILLRRMPKAVWSVGGFWSLSSTGTLVKRELGHALKKRQSRQWPCLHISKFNLHIGNFWEIFLCKNFWFAGSREKCSINLQKFKFNLQNDIYIFNQVINNFTFDLFGNTVKYIINNQWFYNCVWFTCV